MTPPSNPWRGLRRVFRLPTTARRLEREVDDELRFHLQGRIDDLIREGYTPEGAAREAERRFGEVDGYRAQIRQIDADMLRHRSRMDLRDALGRECAQAVRAILRSPVFSALTIATLAIGLGATTGMFALLDRIVLRPLPYPHAERLIHIGTLWPKLGRGGKYALSRGQYFYFKRHGTTLQNLALYDFDADPIPGDATHPAERLAELASSASLFSILGVSPERGRPFTESDERSAVPSVALISHDYWMRRYGGDPSVIGQKIFITSGDGVPLPLDIIGVFPAGLDLGRDVDLWIPNHLDPNARPVNNHTHFAIGLLKPGVTLPQAATEIKALQQQLQTDYPDVYSPRFIERVGFGMNVTWLRDAVVQPQVARGLWILFAGVALVLIIAVTNVANLFLVRIELRRREGAVRVALGASRARLALHFVSESALLCFTAGALGVALGYVLLRVLVDVTHASLPRMQEVRFGVAEMAVCLGLAALTSVTFGLLSATPGASSLTALRESTRGGTSSPARELARRAFIVTQVALGVVLLAAAGLMVKSFDRLRAIRPGFDPNGVEAMEITIPASYRTYAEAEVFWRELARRVEAIPGVRRAGFADALPLTGDMGCTSVFTDATSAASDKSNCMLWVTVSPGYFETMRMQVSGTPPTWADVEAQRAPLIVSKAFAKRFWPGDNPIGHGVKPYNPTYPYFPVVGLAEDVRNSQLRDEASEVIYFPLEPSPAVDSMTTRFKWSASRSMWLVARAPTLRGSDVVSAVRRVVGEMDPNAVLGTSRSMGDIVSASMAQVSITMLLLLLAATIAMVLSAVGIYGVISHLVAQRRTEIGIRMALGAQLADVSRLVLGQSMALAVAGVVVGGVAALAVTRVLGSILYEVTPTDPLVFAGTSLLLLVVAFVATVGPLRRASRIDPVEAMRSQ